MERFLAQATGKRFTIALAMALSVALPGALAASPMLLARQQDSPAPASAPTADTEAAEPFATIPGTRVSLPIPEGFSLSTEFPGFVREDYGAFVIVSEMPAPVQKILSELTKEEIAAQGMKLLRSENVKVNGLDGTLFHATQDSPDGTLRKWLLLFGNDTSAVMLAGSAPAILEPEVGKPMEQAMLAARWDLTKELDPYEGLGFTLRKSEIFEVRGKRTDGILLTRKGAPEQLSPAEPILVVYSATSPEISPLPIFAKRQLIEGSQFKDFTNFSEHPVTVNGLSGYEIIADAKESQKDVAVRILLVAVRTGEQDMVIEGIVVPENWEKYLPEIRGLAESFRVTKDSGPGMGGM